ncbi:hypothetical protein FGO68_gene14609 [Halteria grandinella]|uniref:Uncharacterized protein n=1 Tax=Halteria grandinella TaxID=5974 RepID=A0A8J8SY22_HALGN|nr:hypothetical protein FGO68_gene14609 [Halteria grandinella]
MLAARSFVAIFMPIVEIPGLQLQIIRRSQNADLTAPALTNIHSSNRSIRRYSHRDPTQSHRLHFTKFEKIDKIETSDLHSPCETSEPQILRHVDPIYSISIQLVVSIVRSIRSGKTQRRT